jgi:hypothetical protein
MKLDKSKWVKGANYKINMIVGRVQVDGLTNIITGKHVYFNEPIKNWPDDIDIFVTGIPEKTAVPIDAKLTGTYEQKEKLVNVSAVKSEWEAVLKWQP